MTIARIFKSGNSQALRLPKKFRFKAAEVEIFQRGDELVIREKAKGMASAFNLLAELGEDLPEAKRIDPPPQKRKGL
ncbi:MAG TPA: type II toxin-antitoxin system VapB family antitoxin [Candidatus Acidoferrum sp.]|nr:type II toxin-antitoxin system VapB family antitoxin [Candidatus Acidoferrum sp.]